MKSISSKELIKMLHTDGWVLDRVSGSHHIYWHPDKKLAISVPHPKKTLPIGTLKSLIKQSGIDL